MPWPTHSDIHSHAELLTYLVVSQLLRRHLTGKWLTAEHTIESTHLWMCVNGRLDLLARVSLASQAEELAARMLGASKVGFDAKALAGAFFEAGHIDYRSPAVAEVHRACMKHVMSRFAPPEQPARRNME